MTFALRCRSRIRHCTSTALPTQPTTWPPNGCWGNALNPLDTRTVVKDFGDWRELSGQKNFCSGASDSEMLIASAVDESAGGKLLIAAIASGRSGVTLHNHRPAPGLERAAPLGRVLDGA
ncbi:hypothetical protein PSAN_50710 [Pseudomonas antarctica]|uniref:Acyl-CoA dehydrogenase n=1 Tax=Pseudomonas antarctica TaxID=219572 RepID=A0ABQ6ZR47_9PSED|nr:hypothetical protein [Pseudomonas antarctica]KAF2406888.1 hypothetical protein PSAN_50710 [Pseudomonas antarctica]